MSFLFGNKNREELVAILDIGSSRVGGALVMIPNDKNKKPKILLSVKNPISEDHNLNLQKFTIAMVASLRKTLRDIEKAKLGSPTKVVCFLSSPWYTSQNRTITFSKNTPFVLNQKMIDDLVAKEIKLFEIDHLQKYETETSKPRIIESKITQIMLQGYKVENPIGKKVEQIEMSLFLSVSPGKITESIEKEVFQIFHLPKVQFASFIFSSYAVARDLFSEKENFLLIDIGGEITDIAIIKNDVLLESISFPVGSNFILRKISEVLGKSIIESKSLLNMCLDDQLNNTEKEKVFKPLHKAKIDWLSMFQKSLGSMATDLLIPENIYLITDKQMTSCFIETINNEEFSQYALAEKKFVITSINEQILHNFCDFESDVSRDRFIIIETIFISKKM